MKKMLTGALGGVALVMLLAMTQDDALQAIRQALADIGMRVSRLEAADGAGGGGGASGEAPSRVMVLVSVHLDNTPDDNSEEIADLKQQCEVLNNTVQSNADAAAGAIGSAISNNDATYQRGGVSGWGNRGVSGSSRTAGGGLGVAQAVGDKETENRYAAMYAAKKDKLTALQNAAKAPRQIILGHEGKTIIYLQTKYDMSEVLNSVPIGGKLTWSGTRDTADDNSETWTVDTVKAVSGG